MVFVVHHNSSVQISIKIIDIKIGHSDGTPNEVGLNRDAEAVLEFALKHPK